MTRLEALRERVYDSAFYSGKPGDPFPAVLESYVAARIADALLSSPGRTEGENGRGSSVGRETEDQPERQSMPSAIAPLHDVVAPPPIAQDWQVSSCNGPDWDAQHFTGGVEKIERKGEVLIFHFVAGGQICVNHGVTYVAPERH